MPSITTNWTRENISWAAGLFEGEGCINVKCGALQLCMTDLDTVERFASVVGCGKIRIREPRANSFGKKRQFNWHVTGQERVQAILAAFWPWLGQRRKSRAADFIRHMASAHLKRIHIGESNNRAKLKSADIVFIRGSSEKNVRLAEKFGVTGSTIGMIKANKIWKHINAVDNDIRAA